MIRRRGARIGRIVCQQFGLVSSATDNVTAGTARYLVDDVEIWRNSRQISSNNINSLVSWSFDKVQSEKRALEYGPEAIFRQVGVRDNLQVAKVHTSLSSQKRLPDEDEIDKKRLHELNRLDQLRHKIRPYLELSRLEKPIGTWLLAWPCFWSIAFAAPPHGPIDAKMLCLFGAGAVLLRGAGCTINDMWDRDLDRKVERTKLRPLASGAVTQIQALGWLGLQLTAGLGILLQLNHYSQVLGASSLGLVATYPLMKRITGWPQAFLGLTFNWGALLGWAAVQGSCDWNAVLPLYASGVAWTMVYDTIYAHQDKVDDVKVGIQSTALTFGDATKKYLVGFAGINIASMALAGSALNCNIPFYMGLTAGALQLGWQIKTVDLDDPQDCASKFKSNWWYGLFIFSGIVADKLLIL